MRLIDLSPRWLSPDVFMFRSPSGHGNWLTCKRVAMSFKDQAKLIYVDNPDLKGEVIVTTVDHMAWAFTGNDFNTLSVTPSIDASNSGNWHGFITNGEIT